MSRSVARHTVPKVSDSGHTVVKYEAAHYKALTHRRQSFPELKVVRSSKLSQIAKAIHATEEPGAAARVTQPAKKDGSISNIRILRHLLLDPMNLLLVAAPAGVFGWRSGWSPGLVFCLCFTGLVPLAKLLGDATEHLAENLNQTIGGLLNATFGNAVEMIITLSAIKSGLLDIVKKSLLGSILSNLLLVLGMAFFVGGMKRFEQQFSGAAAVINITMLFVGIMSFSLPTVFSLSATEAATLKISRVSAIFVAIGYVAYLVFQLHTHVEFFEDDKEAEGDAEEAKENCVEFKDEDGDKLTFVRNADGSVDFWINAVVKVRELRDVSAVGRTMYLDGTSCGAWASARCATVSKGEERLVQRVLALFKEAEDEEEAVLSVCWAMALLLVCTTVVAVLSEFMVDSIDGLVKEWGIPEAFVGVILLPIVGNACEHASAVRMAYNNKVATAIAIAVGSSTQIALLVMPFSVLAGWAFDQPLDLNLEPTGLAVLFLSVLVVFSIVLDGKSNWLEGFMLVLAYSLVAVLFWFTPNKDEAGGSKPAPVSA